KYTGVRYSQMNTAAEKRPTGSANMALTQAIAMARHPFADGSYKQMLIDGKWVDADSGKHFQTHNPATGELLATVAEGDVEDINRAVAAARRAFEGSVWVNCYQAMDPAVPFGGYKMSGYGRESGKQHLEEYLNVKAVW